jgi:multidrug efflux pump subunit AcrB
LVALFLIAIVLVAQFNSFLTPLIILGSVVLSLVGVLWGLIITGTPFGIIMTGIGVISLAGVVVNNAIVLLDYVEQLKAQGTSTHDALIQAGLVRFRPVMLTAVTTVLGLVPMAVGVAIDFKEMKLILASQSAEWWGPMAVAVIFGLAFSTVLTLVMVPTFYSITEDLRRLGSKLRGLVIRDEQPAGAE